MFYVSPLCCCPQVVERGELPSMADWQGSKFPLCPVTVDTENRMEDTAGLALQV